MSTPPVPQHCPTPRELDDLELLLSGALTPWRGFNQPGSPVTLTLPADLVARAESAGVVELVDPEGLPLASMTWPAGELTGLGAAEHGPFRRLQLTPAQARARHAGRTWVPVTDALSEDQLAALTGVGPLVLLALTGTGTPDLSPVALVRASLAAAALLPDAEVVAVPLAGHGDPEADHALGLQVVSTYAAGDPVHALVDDDGPWPADVADIVAADRPCPERRGLVLFFTGLSGSGKSTLARALTDRLLEAGTRTVTSLDGDVVRRNLSAGLTFSKADRETNIRRIGWVAAEISRHGGVAVVSPIAPFDETRQQVRAMVEDAGGAFFLVHVATPLEECERRDRKGLYAKARAGEIVEFTGISSPYDEPADADVRVDTTGRSIDDALADVLLELRDQGYLDLVDSRASSGVPLPAADRDGAPLRILFVCTANICRSPTMELLARALAPELEVASAGTHGFVDHPIDDVVAGALPSGTRHEGFRSRRLSPELLQWADLVLTAEVSHRTFVLDQDPGLFRTTFSLGQFASAVAEAPLGLSALELLTHVGTQRGRAENDLDVEDPYRRGPGAARAAVDQIDDLLRAVLPRLVRSGTITR
ncbi:MAG: adenylyl-sulfate kinase [Nocardioides sp.]|nr:adenylyl-sulfate kinase [Nocardioides sp.]